VLLWSYWGGVGIQKQGGVGASHCSSSLPSSPSLLSDPCPYHRHQHPPSSSSSGWLLLFCCLLLPQLFCFVCGLGGWWCLVGGRAGGVVGWLRSLLFLWWFRFRWCLLVVIDVTRQSHLSELKFTQFGLSILMYSLSSVNCFKVTKYSYTLL